MADLFTILVVLSAAGLGWCLGAELERRIAASRRRRP